MPKVHDWLAQQRDGPTAVCEHGTSPLLCGLWVSPVSRVSNRPDSQRTRERDLAVTAAAIMTRTAATAMAMIQRTQSMPGLPLPPKAV